MRQTFEGFLKAYCAELAGTNTVSIRRLCRLAASDAPRVAEPLFLLALERGKLAHLLEVSRGTSLEGEYRERAEEAAPYGSALAYLESGAAPGRYAKVLDAFRAKDDLLAADRRIAGLMRTKTLEALQSGGVTRYCLCRDLGLNPGNVYAYLKGDASKVSRETARRIMTHAQSLAARRS